MKYLLPIIAALSFVSLTNCSSIPEIQPYHSKQGQELTVNDEADADLSSDSVFNDETTTPIADDEPMAPAAPEVKLNADALALKNAPKVASTDENMDLGNADEPAVEPTLAAEPKEEAVAPARKAAKKSVGYRLPSSFKNGLHTFSQDCTMRTKPSNAGGDAGSIQAGKKLWLDSHNKEWLKAYKKSGTVYVSAECIK